MSILFCSHVLAEVTISLNFLGCNHSNQFLTAPNPSSYDCPNILLNKAAWLRVILLTLDAIFTGYSFPTHLIIVNTSASQLKNTSQIYSPAAYLSQIKLLIRVQLTKYDLIL